MVVRKERSGLRAGCQPKRRSTRVSLTPQYAPKMIRRLTRL